MQPFAARNRSSARRKNVSSSGAVAIGMTASEISRCGLGDLAVSSVSAGTASDTFFCRPRGVLRTVFAANGCIAPTWVANVAAGLKSRHCATGDVLFAHESLMSTRTEAAVKRRVRVCTGLGMGAAAYGPPQPAFPLQPSDAAFYARANRARGRIARRDPAGLSPAPTFAQPTGVAEVQPLHRRAESRVRFEGNDRHLQHSRRDER